MANDIKQYTITWYYIYQTCFKEAKFIKDGVFEMDKWPNRLVDELNDYIDNAEQDKFGQEEKSSYKTRCFGPLDDNDTVRPRGIQTKLSDLDKRKRKPKYTLYENYLRDKFNIVATAINNKGFEGKLAFEKDKFEPLLLFSGIRDCDKIDEDFKKSLQNEDFIPTFKIEKVEYVHEQFGKSDRLDLFCFNVIPPKYIQETPGGTNLKEQTKIQSEKLDQAEGIDKKNEQPGEDTPVEPIHFPDIKVVFSPKPVKWYNILPVLDEGELVFRPDVGYEYVGKNSFIIEKNYTKKGVVKWANPRDKEELWVKVVYGDEKNPKTAYFAEPQNEANSLTLTDPQRLLEAFTKLFDFKT